MTSRLLNSNLEKHLGRQPNLTMSLCSLIVQVLEKYTFFSAWSIDEKNACNTEDNYFNT